MIMKRRLLDWKNKSRNCRRKHHEWNSNKIGDGMGDPNIVVLEVRNPELHESVSRPGQSASHTGSRMIPSGIVDMDHTAWCLSQGHAGTATLNWAIERK